MLRGSSQFAIFAAVFFEARRRGDGRVERDAGVLAARGRGYTFRRKEATCRLVSARRGGWTEYCCAVWRTELLPDAANDRDSTAEERIDERSGGPRWIFWMASESGSAGTAVSQEPICDCA